MKKTRDEIEKKGKQTASEKYRIVKKEGKQTASIKDNCKEKESKQAASIKDNGVKKRKIRAMIYDILIIVCIALMVFSVYKIVNWLIENNKSNSTLSEIQSMVKVTQEEIIVDNRPVVKANYDFSELVKRNAETVGWVSVPNSKINYPVVQTNNNEFYLDHSFNKSSNSAGWIFVDCNCNMSTSQNIIIYGHNRRDYSMFGSLKSILNSDWRDNTDNLYVNFADANESGVYKIFSAIICDDAEVKTYLQTNFSTQEGFQQYVQNIKEHSMYKFDTNVADAKKIITLYTCYGGDNKRLMVYAVRVY